MSFETLLSYGLMPTIATLLTGAGVALWNYALNKRTRAENEAAHDQIGTNINRLQTEMNTRIDDAHKRQDDMNDRIGETTKGISDLRADLRPVITKILSDAPSQNPDSRSR